MATITAIIMVINNGSYNNDGFNNNGYNGNNNYNDPYNNGPSNQQRFVCCNEQIQLVNLLRKLPMNNIDYIKIL